MDFTTATAPPIIITIDGTKYTLARFLLPQMKEWAADRVNKQTALATAHLDKDEKARFLMYFQPAPVDILDIATHALSPDGAIDIVDRQMKAAGVPENIRNTVIATGDPMQIRGLASQLSSSGVAAAQIKEGSEANADPLAVPKAASSDAATTGASSSPSSTICTT